MEKYGKKQHAKQTAFIEVSSGKRNQEMMAIRTKIYDHSVLQELNYTLVRYPGRNAISDQVIHKIDMDNIFALLTFDLERERQPAYRMLSKKLDVCKFLEGSYKYMPIANSLLKKLQQMKNFPKSFSLKAYQPVLLDLFVVNWNQLTINLPNMRFTVTATFFTNGTKFSEIILNGRTTTTELSLILMTSF